MEEPRERPRSPRRGRIAKRLLLATLVFLGLFAIADVALSRFLLEEGLFRGRPLPPFGAINHPRQAWWVERHLASLASGEVSRAPGVFDAELGWSNQPSSRMGDEYHIAAGGMRGLREYDPAPPAGVTRILCVGDSFTYGSEVADADVWSAQLEASDPSFEALNFGVASYGTDQALLRYRRVAPRFAHEVACIGILVENIGRNVNRYRPLYYPSAGSPGVKPRFILQGGELVLVPLPFASRREMVEAVADGSVIERTSEHEYWSDASDLGPLAHSTIARLGVAYFAYSARQPRRLWSEPAGEPARVTLEILASFRREALALGARAALVVVFPREAELESFLTTGERYWQPLLDGLSEAGVPWLDVAEDLARELPEGTAARSLYVGGHLNREGNRIVAEAVARAVPEL